MAATKIVAALCCGLIACAPVAACTTNEPTPALDAVMARTTASFDGVQIAYDVHGDGDVALVLVHGWSCDRTYWNAQLASLSADYRVVAIDLAGHGESGGERKAWTIEAFGGDVAAVVEVLGLQHVILVGHSMGGDVAVEAARRLRGKADGVVWVDTYKQIGSPRSAEEVERIVAPFRSDFRTTTRSFVEGMFPENANPALVQWVASDMSAAPPDVATAALNGSLAYGRSIASALEGLGVPIVAINPAAPPTDLASMARHKVDVVLIPDVGHFPMMERPDAFNAVLQDVIGRF